MPPVLLPDTNGVIMDDFLSSVQAFVTKNVCKFSALDRFEDFCDVEYIE